MSGPDFAAVVFSAVKTFYNNIFSMWCRQAKWRKSRSRLCSIRMQAPPQCPVLLAAVSKESPLSLDCRFHSFRHGNTALACSWPVPDPSFDTPNNCSAQVQDTMTGNLSTFSFPIISDSSFPSLWTTMCNMKKSSPHWRRCHVSIMLCAGFFYHICVWTSRLLCNLWINSDFDDILHKVFFYMIVPFTVFKSVIP